MASPSSDESFDPNGSVEKKIQKQRRISPQFQDAITNIQDAITMIQEQQIKEKFEKEYEIKLIIYYARFLFSDLII